MSKSGIQSNRGDGYQTLVAFDWALIVLSDPDYQWLEVDSVTWSVDDVVIGKVDGSKICCQCKKNQTAFKAWSIADLAGELHKAGSLLANDPNTVVRFYSRSPFGELAALREFSSNYANPCDYQTDLGIAHAQTDAALRKLLAQTAPNLSTYEFLRRTRFESSPELDHMETLLRERLRQLASNSSAAYNALWTRLNQLGMRASDDGHSAATQHRLSKDHLKTLLAQAGAMLTPPINTAEVVLSFKSTSAIGRTWRRDVGHQRISSPVVDKLIAAVEAKDRSILLTGMPGSGKTCVMLDLQEKLENLAQTRFNLLPLFIQSREFADTVTARDRHALGLPEQWVEKAARLADGFHVVVVIDSLDVLSIGRDRSALTYFLAQIDRLLLVPNITVITACRDFDRRYDRGIALRTWDKEFTCEPLDWEAQVAPLLAAHDIDAYATDEVTRELIRNPRELALFVELAQQGGSFNVVGSHALAQRYLQTIVQANGTLGDAAMQAIEAIAAEMLKLRSLAVPRQRFAASEAIEWALLSQNVLHKPQDGQLTFGHQTLLDVLVISGALRQGVTLNEFIKSLPPVPFVRPSIRSFLAQLAIGDRRELRKQLRTVLTGNIAFHIRRLVAESLADQIPQDDDWPLIRDLRNQHPDMFQVIYTQAVRVEWHHFWFKHLIPVLKDVGDTEGLTMHVHRVSQWKNDDAAGVLAFWAEVLALDGIDQRQISGQLERAFPDFQEKHLVLAAPLLLTLLSLPRQDHSFLGHTLAHFVSAGAVDDEVLWQHIAGEVSDEDVRAYRFDKKLHCQPHEFGNSNDKFLADRMQKSTELLNLAVATIELWSQVKRSRYGETPTSYWSGFLHETSYIDVHSQTDHRHLDSERILLDAVEAAIVHHANTQSDWWQINCERLCFSAEGAFRYFAILACMAAPTVNLDVIGRMLCDKALLESDLSYELGTLMQTAFLHLDSAWQDAVQTTVLTLHQETTTDPKHRAWMMQKQAQLVITIPCHLRSPAAQAVLGECGKAEWPLVRQPNIGMRGGIVSAPFSFEVFLATNDDAVLRLLAHYNGYARNSFDDFLMGGEREVGGQLREAASRNPTRFLNLITTQCESISDIFRDDIMDGVATFLAHRYGNLQPNGPWTPIEQPDAATLAQQILNELEKNHRHWHHNRAASKALEACAHVVSGTHDAARLVSLIADFFTLEEESSISGDSIKLINVGINMVKGHAAEALLILANQLHSLDAQWPESLAPTLRQFAGDEHPAIRAVMLRRLPYFQSYNADLGWDLFACAMQENSSGLWAMAEPCLYRAYHQQFGAVAPWLALLYSEGRNKDMQTWGRISALAALTQQLAFSDLQEKLKTLNSAEAWRGAASVWTHPANMQQHREQCIAGLEAGMHAANQHAHEVARKYLRLFREKKPLTLTPIALLQRCFTLLQMQADAEKSEIYGFDEWLNAASMRDPMYALDATETYLAFVRLTKPHFYDHANNLTQLLTRLFAQAEEQEESDSGAMLQRVVAVQDVLLALGVNGVNDWLKAAERP